ncbi:unnamed protein product [Ambrosiozyma monospora]|uniref:Unnamed protein product n=1 Tax=Ambrosiozyma monospora TaxID=43982 RepID=A0ACB5TG98_AMBMO|nr:unnamed protein product [Ambrosiozyma monospora]
MMINLRAESIGYKWSSYEPNEFLNIKIPDHTPPGFRRLLDTIKVLHRHEDDFKLIHCKHGKGRTGTVVICYLIWKFNLSFDEASSLFVKKRKVYSSGVTICSQARYCRYFDSFMKLEEFARVQYIDLLKNNIVSLFELEQIEISGAVDLSSHGKFIVKLRNFCEDESDVEEFMQFRESEFQYSQESASFEVIPKEKLVIHQEDLCVCVKLVHNKVVVGTVKFWLNLELELLFANKDEVVVTLPWTDMDGFKGTEKKGAKLFESISVKFKRSS